MTFREPLLLLGLVLVPLALMRLRESHRGDKGLDIPGLELASGGLLGIVWALVNGNADGWTSPGIVGAIVARTAADEHAARRQLGRRAQRAPVRPPCRRPSRSRP